MLLTPSFDCVFYIWLAYVYMFYIWSATMPIQFIHQFNVWDLMYDMHNNDPNVSIQIPTWSITVACTR